MRQGRFPLGRAVSLFDPFGIHYGMSNAFLLAGGIGVGHVDQPIFGLDDRWVRKGLASCITWFDLPLHFPRVALVIGEQSG